MVFIANHPSSRSIFPPPAQSPEQHPLIRTGNILIYPHPHPLPMAAVTFSDLEAFRRCPYAHRLDGTEAFPDKFSLEDCLKRSVRDTIRSFSRSRIMGYRLRDEKVLEAFWNSWDKEVAKVYNPHNDDPLQYIRIGERCIRNFVSQSRVFGAADIVASEMEGTLALPGGNEILLTIQEVGRKGTTAYITRYVTDAEVSSREKLNSDLEMRASALWAMDNLGAREIVMRWVFLVQNLSTELAAVREDCLEAAKQVSGIIDEMKSSKNPLPRESEYCNVCPYQSRCPRFLHELSVRESGPDRGTELADRYLDLEQKKQALRNRIGLLEAQQDTVRAEIVAYSDSRGYMSLKGTEGKILVRHEKKAELPQDKTAVIARLKETGQYESLSMPNYSRLRSDIVKGIADPEIMKLANIENIDKIYVKKNGESR